MRILEDRSFDSFCDRDSAATFCDLEFRGCYFEGCAISVTKRPALRSTVRNVRLVGCSQRGCSLRCAIIESVLVDGFNTNGQLFQTWGAVFNRVVLQGKIDRLMISDNVFPSVLMDEADRQLEIEAFRTTNTDYYRGIEWALDISRGEFKSLDIRGVPGHLIRRDPETQVLVLREKASGMSWRGIDFHENLWPTALELFLERGERSIVLAAPKRHAKFRRYLEDLRLLRKAGITEPD